MYVGAQHVKQIDPAALAVFPGDGRWRWRGADSSWCGSGPRAGTQTGALVPGNGGCAPDFSTNEEKSVVTRHTL